MTYQEKLQVLQAEEKKRLNALAEKVVVVKENKKSKVVAYNGKEYKCSMYRDFFWKATLNGKLFISDCRSFRELRIFIAKHG